ncbi:putative renin receptor [Apostichopus japonicus]|uniref:Putative renin receptor n=1 Tax=Stichopus japonicus TaxID=307972 RepID=A0A2G8L3G6_STIJA|nr:putative renin receptor [Apostichopus japonicus]
MAAAMKQGTILCAILLLLGDFILADDCLLEVVRDPVSQFKSKTSHIPAIEISDVIALSLGMSTEPVSYTGLQSSDIFHRPCATLSLVWEVTPGILDTCSMSQHESISFRTVRDYILSQFGEEGPVVVDYASNIKLTKTPKALDGSLKSIPRTLDGMLETLQQEDTVLHSNDVGSLNASKSADLNFLSELQLIKKFLIKWTPDLYTFVLTGLREIQEEYGLDSSQAEDAAKVMNEFLSKIYKELDSLYKNNILITVIKVQKSPSLRRMIRQATPTEAPPAEPDYNLATNYSSEFPYMFNIILWLVVIFAVSVFAVSYLIGSMDPGDTIIYRMTSQRIKME